MIKYVGKCLLIDDGGEKILAVGDLHLGYEEVLNKGGVFISRTMFKGMLEEFNILFERGGKVDKIVLLGDVKHDFGKILKQEQNEMGKLFEYFGKYCKEIIIVRGNHDKLAGFMIRNENVKIMDFYIWKGYGFVHGDKNYSELWSGGVHTIIMGHIHPAVRLEEGAKMEKYKCFLEGRYKWKKVIVVPSFIEFYEGSDPRDQKIDLAWPMNLNEFEVKVVGERLEVLDFGKLKNIGKR